MTETEGEAPGTPGTRPTSPADRIGVTPTAQASRLLDEPPEATEARQPQRPKGASSPVLGQGPAYPARSPGGAPEGGPTGPTENDGGAVPSAGWRAVAEAYGAEAGQSHGGAATIACTCGKVTPEVQQSTERGAEPVVSDE